MRPTKLATLMATVTVVAMAFVGASTASATPGWTALCEAQELLHCAKENLIKHPTLGILLMTAGSGFFQAGFKIECKSGAGETSSINSQQAGPFSGNIWNLNFSSCSGGCKAAKFVTPVTAIFNMTVEEWLLEVNFATLRFSECTFGVTCEFRGNLILNVKMDGTSSYFDPEGAKFSRIAGSALLCGETLKWETGRTRFSWTEDFVTSHAVWPSLIGAFLIKT